jgi:hypothetical protein
MNMKRTFKASLLLASALSGTPTTWADDGSGAGGEAGAGGAAGAGAEGAGGGGAAAAYYEAFGDEGLKVAAAGWGFKTPQDLAQGYANAEKRLGVSPDQLITLPKDPADQAAYDAIYAKLGRPEKADGYGFKLADNATDADKAMMGKFADVLHKAGLNTSQAKVVGEFINEQTQAQQTAAEAAFTAQAAEGKAALQKDWGGAYDAKAKEIGNLITKYGDESLAKELEGEKLGNYPNLARFLGKVLDRMAEPGNPGGGSGDAGGADRPMTPTQAKAALAAMEAPGSEAAKALFDNGHPQHAVVIAQRSRLLAMADGKQP